jgi:hypothetical protein
MVLFRLIIHVIAPYLKHVRLLPSSEQIEPHDAVAACCSAAAYFWLVELTTY